MKKVDVLVLVLVLVVLGFMIKPFMNEIDNSRLKENHCLEEEMFYYRVVGGFLSSSVETTKGNEDGVDWRCVKWEEEVSIGKVLLGQKLIYEKGTLKNANSGGKE